MKVFFFILAVVALIAIDFYSFQGVKILTKNFSATTKQIINVVYWSIPIGLLTTVLLLLLGVIDRNNNLGKHILFTLIYINYLPKLVFIIFLLIDDSINLFGWIKSKLTDHTITNTNENSNKISRSDFITRLGLAASLIPAYGVIQGITKGAHDYKVYRKTLSFPDLPKSFSGLKIVQLSDIHSGSFFDFEAVKKGIQKVMELKPDLILFTGDLVNNKSDEVIPFIELFSTLKAPLGVFSILGNHDYGDYVQWPNALEKRNNLDNLKKYQQQMGWQLLLDENVTIKKNNESLKLIGVENWGDGFVKIGNLKKAYEGVKEDDFSILMSHDPTHWDAEVRPKFPNINLTLSGHTHGMQLGIENKWLKWSPASLRYKQWGGLYSEENQSIYVNRGFGYLAFPGRIGIRPEITLIELKNKA